MQTDAVSSSEGCKVERTLSPMEQGQSRPSVSRPADRDYFVPINLRQIKREVFTTDHEIQTDASRTSPTLNNSVDTERNVKEEIKDELTSRKELESDCVDNIKVENLDENDVNNETLTEEGTVIEKRQRVDDLNVEIHVEEVKTETLQEADDEESAGVAPVEKCKQTHAEKIQDENTLMPDGKSVMKPETFRTNLEETLRSTANRQAMSINSFNVFVCDHLGNGFGDKCFLIEPIGQYVADKVKSSQQDDVLSQFRGPGVVNERIERSGKSVIECEICKARFSRKENLKTHLRVHTGEKPYQCEICKFRFPYKSSLKNHLRIHSGDKQFECETCKVRYFQKRSLKKHLRIHSGVKPHECEICKVRFYEKRYLKLHLRIHTGEKPYECEICKAKFRFKCNLKTHLRIHTHEKPYECEICKFRFNEKGHLNAHLRIHTNEKPYECDICSVKFTRKSGLKSHLIIHTGVKRYKCQICKIRFTHKTTLMNHLRIHTGEKPYDCEICKAKFAQKGNLSRHLITHVGEKSVGS